MKTDPAQMALLFDFYGELLTEKQRELFDLYHNQDYSLGEIAENEGVTRQGARDALMRAEKTLTDAEAATGLFARFGSIAARLDEAYELAEALADSCGEDEKASAQKLSAILNDMKGKVTDGI